MAKMKHLKKSLLASSMALVMSASALVGTTFAWFTDSVSSANNIIKSGNLDVDVYYGDPTQEKSIAGVDTLFNSVKLWEPGAVAYENLTVANVGSLALKYEMSVNFINENHITGTEYSLDDILKVGLVYGGVDTTDTREEVIADVDQWLPMIDFKFTNELDPYTNEETVGIVIYWEVSDEDNNYNVNNGKQTSDGEKFLHIDLGINLVATQNTVETDGFDNQYDKEATFPLIKSGTLQEGASEGLTLEIDRVTVTVPQGAPAGTYTLELNSFDVQGATLGENDLNTNIALKKDGVNVAPGSAEYNVSIELQPMVDILGVTHNGEPVASYTYDVFGTDISFKTTSFSPFAVEYDVFGTALKLDVENRKILGGLFTEGKYTKTPVMVDGTLDDAGSDYILVDHVRNGKTCHIVSERDTTLFLSPAGGEELTLSTLTGEKVTATVASGKMWSIISGLQNNEHSTVYLLPGTYNEATTVYIYSSMDIIGLGNRGEVKMVKLSSSNSNRHLLNATGTKADYIQVNIYNLTLDATANTTGGKDNAAVQSIRKSKVKCYDLDIIKKANDMAQIAFYVNGNNAVDGVKYPAYLYAENCTLNTTRTFGVVSTAGSYKFYHNNLTYGGTKYTNNSGSIKNIKMASNDWEW